MVLPVKVFEVRSDSGEVLDKLLRFREVEHDEDEGLDLVTEVLDAGSNEGVISGILTRDFLRERTYKRKVILTPTTEEAPFWFVTHEDRKFLAVMAPSVARGVKKLLSNHVASKLADVLDADIREIRITSETLQELHESNPKATNLIWFDNVDIPGVDKLCLSGNGLADTGLYKDYLGHGMIWYVVFTSQQKGYTVGITRNSVITNFSKSTMEEFIQFVREDILKLIQ
jgi:hypothetical protein